MKMAKYLHDTGEEKILCLNEKRKKKKNDVKLTHNICFFQHVGGKKLKAEKLNFFFPGDMISVHRRTCQP